MGISNELCSERCKVSREDQDRYAEESYRRALAAQAARKIRGRDPQGGDPPAQGAGKIFWQDECPQPTSYEQLAKMKPPSSRAA